MTDTLTPEVLADIKCRLGGSMCEVAAPLIAAAERCLELEVSKSAHEDFVLAHMHGAHSCDDEVRGLEKRVAELEAALRRITEMPWQGAAMVKARRIAAEAMKGAVK